MDSLKIPCYLLGKSLVLTKKIYSILTSLVPQPVHRPKTLKKFLGTLYLRGGGAGGEGGGLLSLIPNGFCSGSRQRCLCLINRNLLYPLSFDWVILIPEDIVPLPWSIGTCLHDDSRPPTREGRGPRNRGGNLENRPSLYFPQVSWDLSCRSIILCPDCWSVLSPVRISHGSPNVSKMTNVILLNFRLLCKLHSYVSEEPPLRHI